MTYKLSRTSKRNRVGVNPKLIEISNLAIRITRVDFGHPSDGGLRTAERQNELFRDKLSKADGYRKLSRHQSGRALDFYAFVDGKASWAPEHLSMVAAAFLQAASLLGYRLEWGGLWRSFRDMPHVQLAKDS